MDPVVNPFRPGAGRRPPVLAGRQPILDAFEVMRRRAEQYGEGDRAWVLSGLRGVGKTVLLGELMRQVSDRQWIVAKIEATKGTPLRMALATSLATAMRTATGRHPIGRLQRALRVLKSFSVAIGPTGISLGADIDPLGGIADTGRLGDDLADLLDVLGEASRELGIGTLILVDELQEASREDLAALNTALHHLGQGDVPLPVIFVGAGLPSLPALLADAASYAERLYNYQPISLLDDAAANTALVEATSKHGVTWQASALRAAMDLARGYPYFVQAVGRHVWDLAPGPSITLEDVRVGGTLAREEIDAGLYRSRWERATVAQKRFLQGMVTLGHDDAVEIGELATHLGKARTSDLSVARRELISKGLIYSPERGQVAFTVPGMANFVIDQDL